MHLNTKKRPPKTSTSSIVLESVYTSLHEMNIFNQESKIACFKTKTLQLLDDL